MATAVLLNQQVRQHPRNPESGLSPTQSRSDNNLKFFCEFHCRPDSRRASIESIGEEGVFVGHDWVTVVLPAQCSVYQLRLRICMQAQEKKCEFDPFAILDPEKYTVLYARGDEWYEAYDDCQVLRTLDIPWSNDDPQCLSATVVVKPLVEVDSEKLKKQQQILAYLIGHDLEKEASDRLGEITFTRRKLASPRREELKYRDDELYATEPWITSLPMPSDLQDWLNRKFIINFHYLRVFSFSIESNLSVTPDALLQYFRKKVADKEFEYNPDESLVLKVTGREEFLSGNCALRDFLWVRQCLRTNQDLHLCVIPVSQLPSEAVRFVDWPLVDGFSGQFSSHDDLSLEGKNLDDIFMISLWDCNRKFRVKLLGFDIPKLPNKCPQSVYIKATILYGNKVLSSVCSAPKAFADEVLWNEWLDFDVLLQDLPRGAKLGLTINTWSNDISSVTKESKSYVKEQKAPQFKDSKSSSVSNGKTPDLQKGKGKMLYFVNLLLIDHRSVLSQGPHTLYMWSYPDLEVEQGAITYQADKLSSATNPDVADSMAISFLLDRYSFPVVLPNTSSSTNHASSPTSDPSPTNSNCSSHSPSFSPISPDADFLQGSPTDLIPPRSSIKTLNSNRAVIKKLREESIRYTSSLPQYLRKIKWMNRKEVEEVHWLLGNWDPVELDLTVALELLSMDFPDEVVRRLAARRLESLSNDDVLKYLMQLVQTLKVEPYHDSVLARYLIQRALQSKRVGHFFFWYVRSEVAGCPYFRQRMAVILEAYLLGCGQAMLDSFLNQVQVVEILHRVALDIKSLYPDRNDLTAAAPLRLQEFLKNSNLPDEFLLPFDPRVKAGTILLDKCKVMASKKKPLWLEFNPMPSPTPATPVGIIFKHGDDLRQDMLVIQTLVLMDSIWQENSLDLNLVPYGCIATGYNIGMIEIVRDAVTIAAIQRNDGGTIGAFKNESLFEWLKSKCPLQEIHFKTVERFVKSCAGYCVATYVLGIGDRHNDNIMITDQGNLFHIDFGHILGHKKYFLGVSRERVPFVLTPDFLYLMGRVKGRNSLYFQRFKDTCTKAYLSLRCHSRLLITFFSLMLLTGIPELSAPEDMRYLQQALQDDQNETEARQHFLKQIALCEERGWTVQANFWFHLIGGIK